MSGLTGEARELPGRVHRGVSRRCHEVAAGVQLGLHLLLRTGVDFGHEV